ncbi:hypothetical protein CRE_06958 [Caenorhabditis remanei]|uniref:Uncharacterized protein n=1 Tax=Caenorhabditis remanei TaxID=31234 RepID=E3N6M3_CAERE|nr:hypothetical protein CRE_06958 [Caenorhabditis remanei]
MLCVQYSLQESFFDYSENIRGIYISPPKKTSCSINTLPDDITPRQATLWWMRQSEVDPAQMTSPSPPNWKKRDDRSGHSRQPVALKRKDLFFKEDQFPNSERPSSHQHHHGPQATNASSSKKEIGWQTSQVPVEYSRIRHRDCIDQDVSTQWLMNCHVQLENTSTAITSDEVKESQRDTDWMIYHGCNYRQTIAVVKQKSRESSSISMMKFFARNFKMGHLLP